MIHIGFTNSFVCLLLAGTMLSTSTQAQDKTFNLEEATITEIQNAISSGSVTGKAIVQLYLERIAAYDKAGPKLNSIITVNPKAAEEAAKAAEKAAAEAAKAEAAASAEEPAA